jgi:cell division protein FtsL
MNKLSLMLIVLLVLCSLGVISTQHNARKLYAANDRAANESRQLDAEYERMVVAVRVLANPQRIEATARTRLNMQAVSPARTINVQVQEVRP